MPYNFGFQARFTRNSNYDDIFGTHIGNHFADTMEECFYMNPKLESSTYPLLDNIVSLPDYLTAVLNVFFLSTKRHNKSELSNLFKAYEKKDPHYYNNDVREEKRDEGLCVIFRNLDYRVVVEIIWGAYFLAGIHAEINENIKPARNFLLSFMIDWTGMAEDYFMNEDELMLLYKQHFKPTMKKILLSMKNAPKTPAPPSREELEEEIESLKQQLEENKANDDGQWQAIVEDIVAPFDAVMKPAGFYDIPLIKQLSRPAQCKFITKVMVASMPYKVALLNHIGLMQHLETQPDYANQADCLRLILRALGTKDERGLKGNFNVLKPGSNEDGTKYTANAYVQEAQTFYEAL